MARKTIVSPYYTFDPTTKTIVIPQGILRERIVLITNVTTNQVIYNFSDANNKFTSYSITTDTVGNTFTTVVLQNACTGMASSNKIEILIDEYDEKFTPSEVYTDPVNKFRTSQPQALIDTDFEYSVQSTKWESLTMINNRPFAYFNVATPLAITDITATNGSRSYVLTFASGAVAAGTVAFVGDTTFAGADGLYLIDSTNGSTTSTYTGKAVFTGTTGSIFNTGVTAAYAGSIFTGASITVTSYAYSGTAITVTTTVPHGLSIGNEIAITGTTGATNNPNGSWMVATVTSPTVFIFYATSNPTSGTITGGTLYCRPLGTFNHRPFDGGVTFSTNSSSHNQQMIRQTRRYFRYQSGKGIQISTGTLLKPSLNVDSITASGTTVTVVTKIQHNLEPGTSINVARCNETAYNGNFTVATVLDPYKFTYTAGSAPPSPFVATGVFVLSVTAWNGASCRIGTFDSQNGIYFEFDGQTLYAVRRSSVYQIGGFVSINAGDSTVTGQTTNGVATYFSKQLQPNDFIVIKGMSYRILNITSDTSLTINPPYRGTSNLTNATISKTIETRVPQSQWNLDRVDGTGPSGFTVDLGKMQMYYMDYSWYGAGFIRWGFRGGDGNIIYCHKMINNNVNYEAYMRSGNLPARYEVATFPRNSLLTQTLTSGASSAYIASHLDWYNATPSLPGTVWIRNSTQSEFVQYTGKSQDVSLTGNTISGSTTLTMANTTGTVVGQYIQGIGIPYGTIVNSISTNVSVTMSQAATFSASSSTMLFNPYLSGLTRTSAGGTLTFTATTGSATLTGVSTSGVQIGQQVIGTYIPPGAGVVSFVTNTSITLNYATTGAGGSTSLIFAPMGQTTAQTFTVSSPNTNMTMVEIYAPDFSPTISHWGTSVIMDGRFDDDKSFVFTRGMTTALSIVNGATNAIISLRIAPSVSNGITASTIGTRELINRMQMVLRQMDVFSNGQFLMTLVLNGTVSSSTPNWQSQGGSSLAQYVTHTSGTTVSGGEIIYGFFLNTSGGASFTTTSVELDLIRDMGTSILSGGTALPTTGIYPDGPDVITITAQNIGSSTANIFGRASWTEAQA
jgi:hypothetical protein